MSKNHPYKITFQEEGRGPKETTGFDDLAKASEYIQERWQGADYMDGMSGFHTDYARYTLEGFTLKDIGKVSFDEGIREFTFNPPPRPTPTPPFEAVESIKLYDGESPKPTTHSFASLDEGAKFVDESQNKGCWVYSENSLFGMVIEGEGMGSRTVGTRQITFKGFQLSDVGTIRSEEEFSYVNLFIKENPEPMPAAPTQSPSIGSSQAEDIIPF